MKTNKTVVDTDMQEAMRWYRSLPNAKRRYYIEHCKLTNPKRLTRYYMNAVKDFK